MEALTLAACVGDQFDLVTFAIVSQQDSDLNGWTPIRGGQSAGQRHYL